MPAILETIHIIKKIVYHQLILSCDQEITASKLLEEVDRFCSAPDDLIVRFNICVNTTFADVCKLDNALLNKLLIRLVIERFEEEALKLEALEQLHAKLAQYPKVTKFEFDHTSPAFLAKSNAIANELALLKGDPKIKEKEGLYVLNLIAFVKEYYNLKFGPHVTPALQKTKSETSK